MSEYLNKKTVLEWLHQKREAFLNSGFLFEMEAVEQVIAEIQFGAFDVDQTEIQRLRAALEMTKSELRWGDPTNAIERVERIIDEALSTTTEPINAEKVERVREGGGNE